MSAPSLIIRPAVAADVSGICDLVNGFAARNLMLPRTPQQVHHVLGDFMVVAEEERIVGCGYLARLRAGLVEIRSLAIAESLQGQGIGGELLERLVDAARRRDMRQVCALTLAPEFFLRHGFRRVDRWAISPKIWGECVYCPKFHACDEIAVLRELTP